VLALNPVLAGVLAVLFLILAWLFLPRLWRAMSSTAWLAWRKLNAPASTRNDATDILPASMEVALRRAKATTSPIAQSAYCISNGGPRLPKNFPGWLVRFEENADSLFFVAKRFGGPLVVEIPVRGGVPERKTRFLHEALTIKSTDGGTHRFAFERSRGDAADRFAEVVTPESTPVSA
jgi:hypothetical protein